ncbi:uncharacterized protein NDAI_0E02100 [Naumovozyma dairenensis CBS 421]|uniref:Glycosyltransferase family 91 protein n=1 Tax=Naumovozyma dairenensis (strain ATCC 10597 / BCRC 20456 / CBS 421 / NBRC 0211 / NRRL Y-12639) TaxID=1071378 RepID=G0WBA6_NAUDC|nr:hypothetical protein NDAI_0E02100 [Naumovozyma dairenensis CBS 421]CCD25026.1 hypothetical protein NDAI_0E02100 [Naumovozyma dairenensis CBS 421]
MMRRLLNINIPRNLVRSLTMKNSVYKLSIFVLLITTFIIIATRSDTSKYVVTNYFNSNESLPTKNDLPNVDVSKQLRFQKLNKSPITEKVLHQYYENFDVEGVVTNLDLSKHYSKDHKRGKQQQQEHKSYQDLSCNDLGYHANIGYSTDLIPIEDNLLKLRRQLLKNENKDYANFFRHEESEKNWSEEEIIEKHWSRFGPAPVWLESEQCFVSYSRVMYRHTDQKNQPLVSLIRAQAFDKEWNEIVGKRIPYSDVIIPSDVTKELEMLGDQFQEHACDKLKDSSEYEQCITKHNKSLLENKRRKEKILNRYFQSYPSLIEVPFNIKAEGCKGPEDPHVVLKKTSKGEEPVIIFNMLDDTDKKRKMYAIMPHRKVDPIVTFRINGQEPKKVEKNWTPFFNDDSEGSGLSRGTIHFIYSFKPLEILKCSLTDGLCDIVFDKKFLDIGREDDFQDIHGGTQFIPLPNILPEVQDQKMWLGLPKIHLKDTACSYHYYRPMVMLMIEDKGIYHIEMTVPILDFGLDVTSWDMKGTYCFFNQILSPHSIAYWEVISQDPQTKEYEDYMAITMSEADALSKVMVIKGMLNYILGIYKEKALKPTFEVNGDTGTILKKSLGCVVDIAKKNSKQYNDKHPRPS